MNRKIYIIISLCIINTTVSGQNVGIGTATPVGKLHIKGSSDITQLTIDANATQSNTHPLVQLRTAAGKNLLDIHSDDSTNIYIGVSAGKASTPVSTIKNNIFIGNMAGRENTTGYYNLGIGSSALANNVDGHGNTSYGWQALTFNTSGNYNVGVGAGALQNNSTGFSNTAVGLNALNINYTSAYNTAVGFNAGSKYFNGYNNVFLGANVDVSGAGYYNVVAIGQGTICTTSSQVTIGNGATGSYRAYANWSNISDGRFKRNVQENVPGLDFITKLRPVTYNLNAADLDLFLHKSINATSQPNKASNQENPAAKAVYDKALREKEDVVYTGFVAQDVEAAAKQLGFNFSGIDAPKDANDVYALRYADFVVPLVKAIQEQQQQIEVLKAANADLQKQLNELKTLVNK